jgi:ankyrin repeat protein
LKHGAKIDERNNYGSTALILVAANGRTQMIEVILKHGAKIDEKNNDGDTALLSAAANGHTQMVEFLLKHGAKIDERNNYGNTALILVAANGQTQTVEVILKHGAKIDEQNTEGHTALIAAASQGHIQTVEFLFDYAFENAPEKFDYWGHLNKEGKLAVTYAIENNRLRSVIVFFEHLFRHPGERAFSEEVSEAIDVAFKPDKKEIVLYLEDLLSRLKQKAIRDTVKPSDQCNNA